MLSPKQFESLKKGNVGVDSKKVKVRVPETFKSASQEQKKQIFKLSGFAAGNNFYNIAKSGTVSPKAVLSLSQVLGISPYYLTGESDSKEPCDDVVLKEFFDKCSGKAKKIDTPPKTDKEKPVVKKTADKPVKTVKETTPKPAKTEKAVKTVPASKDKNPKVEKVVKPAPALKKPKAEKVAKPAPTPVKPETVKVVESVKPVVKAQKPVKIEDSDLVKLLESLAIRAKFGGEAELTYNKIVELLIK